MKLNTSNIVLALSLLVLAACSRPEPPGAQPEKELTQQEKVARGKYLTIVAGCNDCHTPKVMTPQGPVPDTTRLLSGHPAGEAIPKVIPTSDWILFNGGLTAAAGPWGVSFAANLTPHETGIGSWSLEQFKTAIRKGLYKGLEGNRPLLPPMPWPQIAQMTDEDLESIYLYLKTIQPMDNLVPQAIPPGGK